MRLSEVRHRTSFLVQIKNIYIKSDEFPQRANVTMIYSIIQTPPPDKMSNEVLLET